MDNTTIRHNGGARGFKQDRVLEAFSKMNTSKPFLDFRN